MVIGIFLLMHDEIKGPLVTNSYSTRPMEFSSDLLSKLYMSHASFNDSSFIETKYPQYKIASLYTGPVARIENQEGILGLVLDLKDELQGTEIFLMRALNLVLKNKNNDLLKELLLVKLPYLQYLLKVYAQFEIENIDEFFMLRGQEEFNQVLLDLGSVKTDQNAWSDLYKQMVIGTEITQYAYIKIDMPTQGKSTYFFGLKYTKKMTNIEIFLSTLAKFLKSHSEFILEQIGMLYFTEFITLIPRNVYKTLQWTNAVVNLDKTVRAKALSLPEVLKKAPDYAESFEKHVNSVMVEEFYVLPEVKK